MTRASAPSPAEVYDSFFGPAVFAPAAAVLLELAAPRAGERVLDLACGTGIVTRRVAPLVGERGRLVAVDSSLDMMAVGQAAPPPPGAAIEWRHGDAVALDLPDGAFDLVLCQQGLQFFRDRAAAAGEMRRVLEAGGRAVVAVWRDLGHLPVLDALNTAVARHLGVARADLAVPFSLGDAGELRGLLEGASFGRVDVVERSIHARFGSADDFVELMAVGAAAVLPAYASVVADPVARAALVDAVTREASAILRRHRDGAGLAFDWHAHVAVARA